MRHSSTHFQQLTARSTNDVTVRETAFLKKVGGSTEIVHGRLPVARALKDYTQLTISGHMG